MVQRLELLHRRINELMEQQRARGKQIRADKELVRHCHAAYETEHGLGMEGQLTPQLIDQLEQIVFELEPIKETKEYKSMSDAVLEIISEKADASHATEIAKAVVEKYPVIAERVKDIEKGVIVPSAPPNGNSGIASTIKKNLYSQVHFFLSIAPSLTPWL
jgi:hypothetical protein